MTFEVIQDDQDEFTLDSTSKRNAYKQQQAILEAAVSATVDHPNIVSTSARIHGQQKFWPYRDVLAWPYRGKQA